MAGATEGKISCIVVLHVMYHYPTFVICILHNVAVHTRGELADIFRRFRKIAKSN